LPFVAAILLVRRLQDVGAGAGVFNIVVKLGCQAVVVAAR
jgi:hypothetical protein